MKLMRFLFLFAMVSTFCRAIDGQCFIATKGGENVKFGVVEILVISKPEAATYRAKYKPMLDKKYDDYTKEYARTIEIMKKATETVDTDTVGKGVDRLIKLEADFARAMDWYFSKIPSHVLAKTLTDADGKFTINLPSAPFYILARAQRKVGKGTEFYAWFIADENFSAPYFLSNNNSASWSIGVN